MTPKKNIRHQSINQILLDTILRHLPLHEALKLGCGKNTIIEFIDPDCPYSRKVNNFIEKRKDITRYVFFYPLPYHMPGAWYKAGYILSALDPATALHDVFSGKFDKDFSDISGMDVMQMKSILDHFSIARRFGIRGTPTMWINGNYLIGAKLDRINEFLRKDE